MRTIILTLAEFLFLACVIACGPKSTAHVARGPDINVAALTCHNSAFALQKQTPSVQQVTTVERIDATCQLHKGWIKERVSMMSPSSEMVAINQVHEIDGYRAALFRLKIVTYNGYGTDHLARADV